MIFNVCKATVLFGYILYNCHAYGYAYMTIHGLVLTTTYERPFAVLISLCKIHLYVSNAKSRMTDYMKWTISINIP